MLLTQHFSLRESKAPITKPITKFGGQPVWLHTPTWAVNSTSISGELMLFLGQIALPPALFPDGEGKMVYLFFEGDAEPLYDEAFGIVIQSSTGTFIPQRGSQSVPNVEIEYVSQATGPIIYELDQEYQSVYKEYNVKFDPIEQEVPVPVLERYTLQDIKYHPNGNIDFQFSKPELAGNKIGGQAIYINNSSPDEAFLSNDWLLLLQLAPKKGYWKHETGQRNFYPFYMELGSLGILTIFLSKDYTHARCFVQQG